jgi:hypothetical protein
MADRPDHDLADRPSDVLAELLHHRAAQNAIVRSYGIMPSSRPEDDDLDRAAAARLRQLAQRIESWGDEIDCRDTDADDLRHAATILEALRDAIAAHEDCCGTDFWPEL